MSDQWAYTLLSVVVVSAISLIGLAAISLSDRIIKQTIFVSVSLAAGAMFGDAFIHILPESFAVPGQRLWTSTYVLFGILTFFVLEKFLRWRHAHEFENGSVRAIEPVGYLNLFADATHNLIDGMLVGASYTISIPVGLATTIAIILHEIPQELGDFGVLIHAGFSRSRALVFNVASGLLAIAGAILSLLASESVSSFSEFMLPFTAGGFIYIAGSDLLPELQKERKPWKSALQFLALISGVGLMYLLLLIG
ncbi:MAG TPA: ZIP family metal transporter [Pyrinomonadaceae bacterium]|nr:ZIP family metal transporter [Pyrinomonadaceae bacterium]